MQEKIPNAGYFIMIFLAGFISVFDNVMNVIYFTSLPKDEQNPVCSKIIEAAGVEGLVVFKALTTILAVILMSALVYTRFRIAIVPVFIFQVLFFIYLNFYASTGMLWSHDWYWGMKNFVEFYYYKWTI